MPKNIICNKNIKTENKAAYIYNLNGFLNYFGKCLINKFAKENKDILL